MPRIARFNIEDACYHVLTRGNNKQKIFYEKPDFQYYKNLLEFYSDKFNIGILHYALMSNHVHLILHAKDGNKMSKMMHGINLKHALYFRKKYGGIGHFWQDRFKSFIIENGIYLIECGRYIELNPVIAGMVEYPWNYQWSSCKYYTSKDKDPLIDTNPEYTALSNNSETRIEQYKQFLLDGLKNKERRSEERFFKIGAYGSSTFIENLKPKGLKVIWSHSGQPQKGFK